MLHIWNIFISHTCIYNFLYMRSKTALREFVVEFLVEKAGSPTPRNFREKVEMLLMVQKSCTSWCFIHPSWCRISSINHQPYHNDFCGGFFPKQVKIQSCSRWGVSWNDDVFWWHIHNMFMTSFDTILILILHMLHTSIYPNAPCMEHVPTEIYGKSLTNIHTSFWGSVSLLVYLLVGGFNPFEKICSSNMIISQRFGVKIRNIWNHIHTSFLGEVI